MTFKTLSNIIKKHKEQPTQLARQQEQELAKAQAAISTLRANHYKAYHERGAKWEREHPDKKFYEMTEEDNRKDCILDEWFWNYFERIHAAKSPEVRYQLERNPAHGLGHKSKVHGLEDKCVPGCRYYESTGRLTVFEILEEYRDYQQFEEVLRAYKELQTEGVLAKK